MKIYLVKKSFITLSVMLLAGIVLAQVPKKIIVEHFTNTKCGNCAFRNPDLYDNLDLYPDIVHLAFHPSSPYSTCALNLHNVSENDDRVIYYNEYGATPEIVVQGDVIPPSTSYTDTTIWDPYQYQTTEASISIYETKHGMDSIEVTVSVKTEASHTYGNLRLFVCLAEDTVFYTGSNGEPEHYDVFRKSLTAAEGNVVTLPAAVGDSIVFTATQPTHVDWDFDRIKAVALLQDETTKDMIQSEDNKTDPPPPPPPSTVGIEDVVKGSFVVFPNPTSNQLSISRDSETEANVSLLNVVGQPVLHTSMKSSVTIDVTDQPVGAYLLRVEDEQGATVKRVLISR